MNLPPQILTHKSVREALASFLKDRIFSNIAVLVDENTNKACYPLIKEVLPFNHLLIQIKSGEEEKNLQTCSHIWQQLTEASFDRKGLLINLGGGVITDMGGFCAATYKRGIHFINIPTTLLSQVDASVGGKLGIDFMGFKNHIGLFQEPELVIIDSIFLKTLDIKELRSGYAEVVKHALIADGQNFEKLKKAHWEELNWQQIIPHSVAIKYKVVSEDPTEKDLRKILNYGHTIGHAIESFYLDRPNQRLLHGEAIAIGMICEAYLSYKKAGLSKVQMESVCNMLYKVWNNLIFEEKHIPAILGLLYQDKKNEKGQINCSLLRQIGEAVFDCFITEEEAKEAMEFYIKRGWS